MSQGSNPCYHTNFKMPRKPKVVYQKRAFLNDDKSMSGFIIAYLEEFLYHETETRDRISAYPSLDIGDCSNKVSLDFSFYNTADLKRALKKLRLFRDVVDGFADAFENEAVKAQEKLKQKPKKAPKVRVRVVETIDD